MAPWILPIAVITPVPTTMHLALPAVTTVPCVTDCLSRQVLRRLLLDVVYYEDPDGTGQHGRIGRTMTHKPAV